MSINPLGDSHGDLTQLAAAEEAVVVGERFDGAAKGGDEAPANDKEPEPPLTREKKSNSRECLTLFGSDC